MELTERQSLLFDFVKLKHGDQKRKYTGEPYYTHLYSVAEIVSQYEDGLIEIALCHDLFEDTQCDFNELYKALVSFGYGRNEAYDICTCVKELTDVFTHTDYPYFNRKKRKILEAERLSKCSYKAQTVKLADIMDNSKSILEHDKSFGGVYLPERIHLLGVITNCNKELYKVVCSSSR